MSRAFVFTQETPQQDHMKVETNNEFISSHTHIYNTSDIPRMCSAMAHAQGDTSSLCMCQHILEKFCRGLSLFPSDKDGIFVLF